MVRLVLALAAALVLVGACGASPPTAHPTQRATTSPTLPVASAAGSTGAPSPLPSASSGSSATAASVPIDPSLLDLLPVTVGGYPVTAVPQPSGTDDPGLIKTVSRMVEAVVIDPNSGDFAYASVIVLRSGVFDSGFFRSWRDSFDAGACSQAGGVTGHDQTSIGGRTTYVGRCGGGVLTYHVRLDAEDAIVSVSSLGKSLLGEQIVTGLRP